MSNDLQALHMAIKDEIFFIENTRILRKFLSHKDYFQHIINAIDLCIDDSVRLNHKSISNALYKSKITDRKIHVVLEKIFQTKVDTDQKVLLELLEQDYVNRESDQLINQLSTIKSNKSRLSELIGQLECSIDLLVGSVESGVHIDKAFTDYINRLKDSNLKVLLTGFETFDWSTTGIKSTDTIGIGGDTSHGKTILLYQLADLLARLGFKVGLYSLEMDNDDTLDRVITKSSGMSVNMLKMSKQKGKHLKLANKVKEFYKSKNVNLYLHDSLFTWVDIKASAKQNQYDIIFIDYWQLCDYGGDKKFSSRQLELAEISRSSKLFSKKEKIPTVWGAQLTSSKIQQMPMKIPNKHCLRDSTSLANDVSNLIFIYRPELYGISDFMNHNTDGMAWLINDKARNNALSCVRTKFNNQNIRFEDIKEEVDVLKRKITGDNGQ